MVFDAETTKADNETFSQDGPLILNAPFRQKSQAGDAVPGGADLKKRTRPSGVRAPLSVTAAIESATRID